MILTIMMIFLIDLRSFDLYYAKLSTLISIFCFIYMRS